MRIEQITRVLGRMARVGGIRIQTPPLGNAVVPRPPRASGPAGSGSWANAWSSPLARATGLAKPAEPSPKDGKLRARPLLDGAAMRLHNWLSDRLEEVSPTCILHARVALSAFIGKEGGEKAEGLDDLSIDLLVVDGGGHACVALLRQGTRMPDAEATIIAALEEADIPLVTVAARHKVSRLWSEIEPHLPEG